MEKGFGVYRKSGIVGFQLSLLIGALFGFSYMISSMGFVGAEEFINGQQIKVDDDIFTRTDGHWTSTTNIMTPTDEKMLKLIDEDKAALITEAKGGASNVQVSTKSKGQWSSMFESIQAGSGVDALVSGLQWAAYAYMAGQMIGPMLGLSDDNTEALSTAMAAGFGAYSMLSTYTFGAEGAMFGESFGFLGTYSPAIGLGIGIVVFVATYEETETEIVTFNCMPWQAPVGGDACEICNDDNLPCSEYRCRALGQNCEIVNEGTVDEKCVNVNPNDVNPPVIKPNYNELTSGHSYKNVKNSPPGPGFDIVNDEADDGCLKAFTPLEFGITVNEPAQCKIDFNHTTSFEDMVVYVGGSNLYSYNHSERFSLPSAAALKNSSLVLANDKDLTFFIRCRDKNGNDNGAEYAVNFCIDPTPDTTAPRVEATSVLNGGCVAENSDSAEVMFYTNEPSYCRWSFVDQGYDSMGNDMDCSGGLREINAMQLFGCEAELTGIPRDGTNFYIRCEDRAEDVNVMAESYEFSLRGSTGLVLKSLYPNETVFGAVNPMPVELYVETLFGCNDGRSICSWSDDGNDYVPFFDTNNDDGIHTQRLDLVGGNYEYFVRCVDDGGNVVDDSVKFSLNIDTNAPVVARVYEEDQMLKIVTVRDSECVYTFDGCDFSFDEGTEMPYANSSVHVAEWNEEKTYYIKCRDEFLNEEGDCSIIIRPTRDFL